MMNLPFTVTTHSAEETEELGRALAACFAEADCTLPPFVALYGDLGVGKTAFVRGFASVLSPASLVRSPTFALVNEYRAAKAGSPPLFHFDMYRIESEDDLWSIGYDDYLSRGICLVEWSENIPFALPDEYVKVTVKKCPEQGTDIRNITILRQKEF